MNINSANASYLAKLSHISRSNNTARRESKLALAELAYLKSTHPTTYIEDRLINLRSQLLKLDKLIGKCRDSKRLKDIAIAAKFLNDQERALVRPMTIAEAKEVAKAAKAKPPSNDGI